MSEDMCHPTTGHGGLVYGPVCVKMALSLAFKMVIEVGLAQCGQIEIDRGIFSSCQKTLEMVIPMDLPN